MYFFTKLSALMSALVLFVTGIFSTGIQPATKPENPEVYDDTIMFFSDFQSSISDLNGPERTGNFSDVLSGVKDENPGLVVGGGDYQSMFFGTFGTAFGISLVKKAVNEKWNYGMQYLFVQGNHDTPKSVYLNDTGLYEFDKYVVYTINEDDYPWNEQIDVGIAKKKVEKTAAALDKALSALAEANDTRPVFVVSHLPLHYSTRSSGNDNRYASYIFDAINNNADNLNIVYLYGHNHSSTYDDYIGGAVNYLAKGETMKIGGSDEEKTLGFTYTNCGYSGYSNNSDNETSTSALTVTFATVSGSDISIRKYSKDGKILEKDIASKSAALDIAA